MLHGELASPRILTEQSIFIKDSEQFQSIFWNHIIIGNICLHLNIYRRCIYEERGGLLVVLLQENIADTKASSLSS